LAENDALTSIFKHLDSEISKSFAKNSQEIIKIPIAFYLTLILTGLTSPGASTVKYPRVSSRFKGFTKDNDSLDRTLARGVS
jgi:hypothetical protein